MLILEATFIRDLRVRKIFMLPLQFVSILVVSVNSATIDPHKPHTTIDPHSPGPHCWDVSTYGNVYYRHVKREKCMTEFPKIPVPRKKRVSRYHSRIL